MGNIVLIDGPLVGDPHFRASIHPHVPHASEQGKGGGSLEGLKVKTDLEPGGEWSRALS